MVRGKLQFRLIEDRSSRQVTFWKRRSGLMKKARELSVLCGVDVALLIFSDKGKLYEYSSNNCLGEILDRYQISKDVAQLPASSIDNKVGKCLSPIQQPLPVSLNQLTQLTPPGPGDHQMTAAGYLMDHLSDKEVLSVIQRRLEGGGHHFNLTKLDQLEHHLNALVGSIQIRKKQLMAERLTPPSELMAATMNNSYYPHQFPPAHYPTPGMETLAPNIAGIQMGPAMNNQYLNQFPPAYYPNVGMETINTGFEVFGVNSDSFGKLT